MNVMNDSAAKMAGWTYRRLANGLEVHCSAVQFLGRGCGCGCGFDVSGRLEEG